MTKKKIGVVVATMGVLFLGCNNQAQVTPPKAPAPVTQNKPAPTPVAPAPSGLKLQDLQSKGVAVGIELKGTENYAQNEPVRFSIDTGNNEGYLYIIYLDNQGNT